MTTPLPPVPPIQASQESAFPRGSHDTVPGMTLPDYATIEFTSAWIQALSTRGDEYEDLFLNQRDADSLGRQQAALFMAARNQ